MTNTTIGLTLFSLIRLQFGANIGITYNNFSYFEEKKGKKG